MNAMRSFVLAGMLAASNMAATVQASEPLVLHAGKAAFSIEVPSGWKVRTLERRTSGRVRWEASENFTDLPKVDGLPEWQLTEAPRSVSNAYVPLGSDVVVVSLRAQGCGRCDEGKTVLLKVLKSYREVGNP
jgi:hypothetical protein